MQSKFFKQTIFCLSLLIPVFIKKNVGMLARQLKNFYILSSKYAQFDTIRKMSCLDCFGRPIPWYTYPAFEYLNNLDLSAYKVVEFGSGNSSLWWARKCRELTAVEDDSKWYANIMEKSKSEDCQFEYVFAHNVDEYLLPMEDRDYDIIIIDGRYRIECAEKFMQLKEKSKQVLMLIFDNADWYPSIVDEIKSNLGWIQVDFHGFGPINNYTWTTSVFFNPQRGADIGYVNKLKSMAGIAHELG